VSPMFVDLRVTVPALEAGAVKVTVQVPKRPGITDCGVQLKSERAEDAGDSEIVAVAELAPEPARMVAVCTVVNDPAVAINEADLVFAAAVREAGTFRAVPAVVEMEISAPPAGDALNRMTVQAELMPGVKVVIAQATEETPIDPPMLKATALDEEPIAAVMFAV
jgi:hypothetical protein